MKKIRLILDNDDWQSRIAAVKEARELVLEEYQPVAGAAAILNEVRLSAQKKDVIIKTVHPGLLKIIKTVINKLVKN
ncbi:MAG: hypothetical protein WDN26_04055 [Chitinophagaceae bacterium]